MKSSPRLTFALLFGFGLSLTHAASSVSPFSGQKTKAANSAPGAKNPVAHAEVIAAPKRPVQTVTAAPLANAVTPLIAVATTEATPSTSVGPSEIGPGMALTVGKSTLLRLPSVIDRISVGNPNVADVTLISARELYLLGKSFGTTNIIMWRKGGPTTIIDVTVQVDGAALAQRLALMMPEEKGVQIRTLSDAIILSGIVSSAPKAEAIMELAEAFSIANARAIQAPSLAGNATAAAGTPVGITTLTAAGGQGAQQHQALRLKVINLMRIGQAQQVMLEVQVAEVSKTLLDKLGAGFKAGNTVGSWRYSILTDLLSSGAGALSAVRNPTNGFSIDAEKKDGLVKILAEPNIVAISGQEASFLAGGKLFIPVARSSNAGVTTITLEEKEFGVGLKFTPTVLDGGRINLKVSPEVSELSQTGSPFTTVGGVTSVLPSFTVRRAQTTVQLMDGQSFAIAGLIKNNVSETIKRIPMLGEIPILGALFRSSEFQTDRTELMFVITPRLIKPLGPDYALPTDNFTPPSRGEFFLDGKIEGSGNSSLPSDRPAAPNTSSVAPGGGYQIK